MKNTRSLPEVFTAWRTQRDGEAATTLISTYHNLVISLAGRYARYLAGRGGTVAVEDLEQLGNYWVLHSAITFDPSQNVRFLPYALLGIRGTIRDHVDQHSSAVYIPRSASPLLDNFRREKQ